MSNISHQFVGSHPDEVSKAEQVVDGTRNWTHPQLLVFNLELGKLLFVPDNLSRLEKRGRVVRIGRYISNIYAAGTVLLFAVIGGRLFGVAGACAFFAAFAANSAILISGRYVKEDIFLLFGLSVLSLALTFRSSGERSGFGALVGGVGCAVVISSKYVGAVFILPFLLAFLYEQSSEWRSQLSRLFWPFLVSFLIFNHRLLFSFADFIDGFGEEFDHATGGHEGIITGIFSPLYIKMIGEVIPLAAIAMIPVFVILLLRSDSRISVGALLVFSLFSIVLYGALIQWAPSKVSRYSFPILVLIPFAFLISAGELWATTKSNLTRMLIFVPAFLFAGQTAWTSTTIVGAIRNDTRDQLLRHITTSPDFKNALIMTGSYPHLWRRLRWEEIPWPNYPFVKKLSQYEGKLEPKSNPNGIRLRWSSYAADPCFFGDCKDVDYVIIACTTFSRFFRSDIRLDAANERRRKVYERWVREGNVKKRFGFFKEDFEERFGLYESPCIYILDNEKQVK